MSSENHQPRWGTPYIVKTPAQEQIMRGYGASSEHTRATEENARLGGWQEVY